MENNLLMRISNKRGDYSLERIYTLRNTFKAENFGGSTDISSEHTEYCRKELELYRNKDKEIVDLNIDCSDHYIKHFTKEDMKMYIDYPGYSFVIPSHEYDNHICPVCTVLIKDDDGDLQINSGILDNIAYRILYKDNGDIVINTLVPFNGVCVIEGPEIYGAKIYFQEDSWETYEDTFKIQISTLNLGIKMIYYADILTKDNETTYLKTYGILDNVDYMILQNDSSTLTITSKNPFAGLLLIRGDIHINPHIHIT